MSRLRPANLDHGGHGDAPFQVTADDVVLGRTLDGDPLHRHVGAAVGGPAWGHLQDGMAADAKASAINGRSEPGSSRRCREVDQAEIPFRVGDTFLEPGNAGKILIAGAIEVIDRDINTARPRRKGAKYLGTRSGRLRLAMIADNTATSIEAFVRANVKRGSTLISDGHASYPGLSGDYRHDPRVVGKMAAHIVLPWSHRAFSLLKRGALGTYHGLRRKHVDTYLDEFVFRYNRRFYRHVSFEPCWASPSTTSRRAIGTSSSGTTPGRVAKRSNPRTLPARALHIDRPE